MFRRYDADQAPEGMRDAARALEEQFAIRFETLTHFTPASLAELHSGESDDHELMEQVDVASHRDSRVAEDIRVLTSVANTQSPADADRIAYFAALRRIYERVGVSRCSADDTIVVAPEREGRILAESLGWLTGPRDTTPHAKRIAYDRGLLVGATCGVRGPLPTSKLIFVDGAIASGGTMIALLDRLAQAGMRVDVYSVHAAREGLRAVLRYAKSARLEMAVHIGHVTDGLSKKFYAVEGADHHLVVGDLGDTIAAVAARAVAQ